MRGRQVTTAVTLLALCGILVLGLVVGYRALFQPLDEGTAAASPTPTPSATSSCDASVKKGTVLRTRDVQVSVYNSGERTGLAGSVMKALARRGFKRGEVANAPSGVHVDRVQVWTTVKHDVAAALVARQFAGKVKPRVHDKDLGPGIAVVVGDGYRSLGDAKTSIRVRGKGTVCGDVAGGGHRSGGSR